MCKQWNVYGIHGEYCFLNIAAQCKTEADVRSWMRANYPSIQIERIEED